MTTRSGGCRAVTQRLLSGFVVCLLVMPVPGHAQAQQAAVESAAGAEPPALGIADTALATDGSGEGDPALEPAPVEDPEGNETAGRKGAGKTLDLDEILNTPADAYVDTPRCIRVGRIRDTDVIDNQHIAFKVSKSKYYLVQLAFPCPTMRRDSTIMHSSSGMRICALDRVQAVSGYGMSRHTGPPCQIPGFQEITHEQLVLLKERLKERRRGDLIDEIDPDDKAEDEGTSAPAEAAEPSTP